MNLADGLREEEEGVDHVVLNVPRNRRSHVGSATGDLMQLITHFPQVAAESNLGPQDSQIGSVHQRAQGLQFGEGVRGEVFPVAELSLRGSHGELLVALHVGEVVEVRRGGGEQIVASEVSSTHCDG